MIVSTSVCFVGWKAGYLNIPPSIYFVYNGLWKVVAFPTGFYLASDHIRYNQLSPVSMRLYQIMHVEGRPMQYAVIHHIMGDEMSDIPERFPFFGKRGSEGGCEGGQNAR
jgi:hypothetical protein